MTDSGAVYKMTADDRPPTAAFSRGGQWSAVLRVIQSCPYATSQHPRWQISPGNEFLGYDLRQVNLAFRRRSPLEGAQVSSPVDLSPGGGTTFRHFLPCDFMTLDSGHTCSEHEE